MPKKREQAKRDEEILGQEITQETHYPQRKSRELWWILGFMVIIILVFFVSYTIIQEMNNFEYQGMSFTKEMFGEIPVYHHYYYYNTPEGELVRYNLYLRNDPRKNSAPITGDIIMSIGTTTYLSVDGNALQHCEYSSVAIANLASFLTSNLIRVKSAAPDKTLAEEAKTTYATCDTHPEDIVIILTTGNETKISEENNRCYVITAANCEILQAVEKFQVQSIIDARKRKGAFPITPSVAE